MESRKVVLMNLFVRQQQRNRHREQTFGNGRGQERVRSMERVTWKLTLPYVKQIANQICCTSQGTQTGALYQPRGEGTGGRWENGSRGRGHMYTYVLFMLMFGKKTTKSYKAIILQFKNKLKKKDSLHAITKNPACRNKD